MFGIIALARLIAIVTAVLALTQTANAQTPEATFGGLTGDTYAGLTEVDGQNVFVVLIVQDFQPLGPNLSSQYNVSPITPDTQTVLGMWQFNCDYFGACTLQGVIIADDAVISIHTLGELSPTPGMRAKK